MEGTFIAHGVGGGYSQKKGRKGNRHILITTIVRYLSHRFAGGKKGKYQFEISSQTRKRDHCMQSGSKNSRRRRDIEKRRE